MKYYFQVFILLVFLQLIQKFNCVNQGEQEILQFSKKFKFSELEPEQVNIHLFPHSHTDVGWLKTIDDYLFGTNSVNEWMVGNATQTLNSVIDTLFANDKYKFVWAEQAYFSRWYLKQNIYVKELVKHLIQTQQFSLVGGGWVVNDEACTYYEDIIDQQTVGHQFLDTFLNFHPTMGWQQDPFGHSQTHAWIMSQMGLNGMMMSRIDYQYVAPEGYEYDFRFTKSEYNQYKRGQDFSKPSVQKSNDLAYFFRNVSNCYATDEFVYSLGNDFTYLDANFSFQAYDEYLKNINENKENLKIPQIDYIRADDFLKILHEKQKEFPTFNDDINDDFFPYRDTKGAYWSGYFTSLPYFKKMVMDNGRLLQKIRNYLNLYFLSNNIQHEHKYSIQFTKIQSKLLLFEQEIAAMQHHDAVTGTSKKDVAKDYEQRVLSQRTEIIEKLEEIISLKARQELRNVFLRKQDHNLRLQWCNNDVYKNEECEVKEYHQVILNIQHYGTKNTTTIYRVKGFKNLENFRILDVRTHEFIPGELLCINDEQCYLYFEVDLSPFQNNYFLLEQHKEKTIQNLSQGQNTEISLGEQKLNYNENDEYMFQYSRDILSKKFLIKYDSYNANQGRTDPGNGSGAYIFRTHQQSSSNILSLKKSDNNQFNTQSFNGNFVSCLVYTFDSTSVHVCLKKHQKFVHLETKLNKNILNGEIILFLEFQDFDNNKKFQTDSNGLFRMDRVLSKPQEKKYFQYGDDQSAISGNFYPVTKFLTIKQNDEKITVMNDRSQAGSSLQKGQIQFMIHRQTEQDDNRGVGQKLQDKRDYIFNHFLLFNLSDNEERKAQLELDTQQELFLNKNHFSRLNSNRKLINRHHDEFIEQFLENIPENVKFNLKYKNRNQFLLRLQNFQDQDQIQLNLESIILYHNFTETNIQGTRTLQQVEDENLKFYSNKGDNQNPSSYNPNKDNQNHTQLILKPLDIRTFIINLKDNETYTNIEDVDVDIWAREEHGLQKFCHSNCYKTGLCVWDQCTCLNSYGDSCNTHCDNEYCLVCDTKDQCEMCLDGFTLQSGNCTCSNDQCMEKIREFSKLKPTENHIFLIAIIIIGLILVGYLIRRCIKNRRNKKQERRAIRYQSEDDDSY